MYKMEASSEADGELSRLKRRVKELAAKSEADLAARLNAEKKVDEVSEAWQILANLNAELYIKLAMANNANNELKGEVRSLSEKNYELEMIIEDKDSKLCRLSESNAKVCEDLYDKSDRIRTLAAAVLSCKEEYEEREKENTVMREEMKSLSETNDELKKKLRCLNVEMDKEMNRLIKSKQKACEDLQEESNRVRCLRALLLKRRDESEANARALADMKKLVEEKDKEFTRLSESHEKTCKELEAAQMKVQCKRQLTAVSREDEDVVYIKSVESDSAASTAKKQRYSF